MQAVETMRWDGRRLALIDQRILPQRFEYVECTSAADVAAAIRDMVVRGAPAIGCAAAYGIAVESLRPAFASASAFHAALASAFEELAESRPTAVNLFWALDRMRRAYEAVRDAPPEAVSARLVEEAIAIQREDLAVNRAMGRHGAELIADGARIMTHCNAGALATSGYGTALGVIRAARDAGKRVSVIANETRPFLQGARLTAWEMVQEAIPVTVVTDSMAGALMQAGKVDVIVVGADRIAANGDVANKIGTYTLAVVAARHCIPFYVAAPVSTFDPALAEGAVIPIEQRSPDEVTGFRGVRWAPEGVAVDNPAFDVTPAELVTAIITEKGIVPRPDAVGVAAMLAR
jgi:methylthioribose-1-phosphate isomerase